MTLLELAGWPAGASKAVVLRADPFLYLGTLRNSREKGRSWDKGNLKMPAARGQPAACSFCVCCRCANRSQGYGVLQYCLPSIPAWPQSLPCPAWQHYMGTGAAGEAGSFWSRHPHTHGFHPSSVTQSGPAQVASEISSPGSPLKALLSSGTLSLLS